jgi:hypothetical protein
MLTTTLTLTTVRTNGGKTAVVANLSDGRECFVGLSDSIGRKRAMYDVLAGSGATMVETTKTLARLEKVERAIIERAHEEALTMDSERNPFLDADDFAAIYGDDGYGDDDLLRAAAELGIDLDR